MAEQQEVTASEFRESVLLEEIGRISREAAAQHASDRVALRLTQQLLNRAEERMHELEQTIQTMERAVDDIVTSQQIEAEQDESTD